MTITFNKYHGAGNDFIIIDNRDEVFNPENYSLVRNLCNRRTGIGADGLILIGRSSEHDFEMIYYNSDGFPGSMCGNGGRCSADFAIRHGIAGETMKFIAADGIHEAVSERGLIRLKMNDVNQISKVAGNYSLNTGSPHCIVFTSGLNDLDVYNEGKKIRWSLDYQPGGTNVNFVEPHENEIHVRTFERGVEDETLSCGTGVTASAIASVLSGHFVSKTVNVRTMGGNLKVDFNISGDKITDIWLSGPATFVFEGRYSIIS
jgi:diaminopimelate epimerase